MFVERVFSAELCVAWNAVTNCAENGLTSQKKDESY